MPDNDRLGIRNGIVQKIGPQGPGLVLADSASDSKGRQKDVLRFEVEQSEWGDFSDFFGPAVIPYRQTILMETKYKRVTLDFHSQPENYNRLLFPHQDYIFSDFEGLGVTCHVKIEKKNYYWWWFWGNVPVYENEYEFTSNDAGIQYGYEADIQQHLFNGKL